MPSHATCKLLRPSVPQLARPWAPGAHPDRTFRKVTSRHQAMPSHATCKLLRPSAKQAARPWAPGGYSARTFRKKHLATSSHAEPCDMPTASAFNKAIGTMGSLRGSFCSHLPKSHATVACYAWADQKANCLRLQANQTSLRGPGRLATNIYWPPPGQSALRVSRLPGGPGAAPEGGARAALAALPGDCRGRALVEKIDAGETLRNHCFKLKWLKK